jgi:dienelactone hydrolase
MKNIFSFLLAVLIVVIPDGLLTAQIIPPWNRIAENFEVLAIIDSETMTQVHGVKFGPYDDQYIDIYYSASVQWTDERRPMFTIYPGGGFDDQEGTLLDWREHGVPPWAKEISDRGIIIVLANFRRLVDLREQEKQSEIIPAQELAWDALAPLDMIKKKPDVFGVNPERIGVIGYSAGGWMAAYAVKNNLACVAVLTGAPLDFRLEEMWHWRVFMDRNGLWEYPLSPIEWLKYDTHPTLVICGLKDELFPNNKHPWPYYRKALDRGVYADWLMTPAGHNVGGEDYQYSELVNTRTVKFLSKFLIPEHEKTLNMSKIIKIQKAHRASYPEEENPHWDPEYDMDLDGEITHNDFYLLAAIKGNS